MREEKRYNISHKFHHIYRLKFVFRWIKPHFSCIHVLWRLKHILFCICGLVMYPFQHLFDIILVFCAYSPQKYKNYHLKELCRCAEYCIVMEFSRIGQMEFIFLYFVKRKCARNEFQFHEIEGNPRLKYESFHFPSFHSLLLFSFLFLIGFYFIHDKTPTQWDTSLDWKHGIKYINRPSRMNENILSDNQDEESQFATLSYRNSIGCVRCFCHLSNEFHFLSVWLMVSGCCDKQCISI